MELNNDDFTYDMYLANLQDKCDDGNSSIQCCILQYMIVEKEELLIRFVNEFTHFWKNSNIIKTKHTTDECKIIPKKKLWGDSDDDNDNEC